MIRKSIQGMIWILAWVLLFLPNASIPASPQLSTTINLLEPERCPTGGCAAGQRLNFQAGFDLLTYEPSENKNIQICLYVPENWGNTVVEFDDLGAISGATYTPDTTNCSLPLTGYNLVGGVSTALFSEFIGDSLEFNFRMGESATNSGLTLIKIYQHDGTNWIETIQESIFIPVVPSSNLMFVANDAESCAEYSPCYVNSKDDLVGGIGTGLKDAIDIAVPNAVIKILGDYQIKANTIQVNQPVSINSELNSSITTTNTNCIYPMLSLEDAVKIQNLTINDGVCNSTNRDLIEINSTKEINISSNNLVQGRDAISINSNFGNVNISYNNIKNNSRYAILTPIEFDEGQLLITANNIYNNRTGVQIDCNNLGIVDHNYWGLDISPETATNNCTFSPGKLLGSPIIDRVSQPGVQAIKIPVTTTKTYYFENQIAVQRPSIPMTLQDFDIYIVNHGSNAANTPFLSEGSISSLVPCNNYYDIFLANEYVTDQAFELFLKYNANAACVANIESSTYCGQLNPAFFPLWWYDPNQLITTGWNTTGQSPNGPSANQATGQVTTCRIPSKEISVLIDATGRPGINNDLTFTPFTVGIIGQPAAAVLTSFTATPGDEQVKIDWKTSTELNTSGYYIQRRITGENLFERVSSFITKTGSDSSGGTYSFIDQEVTNFTSYDYRLEIVGTNLLSVYSNTIKVTPIPPTNTPTITLTSTITQTLTLTRTLTGTVTLTPTITLTPTVTSTRTITLTPTRTRYRTPTRTRTPFIIPYRSPTKSRTPFVISTSAAGYPAPSGQNGTSDSGYPIDTNMTPVPEGGYPAPGEATAGNEGYPVPGEEGQNGTPPSGNSTSPAQTRTSFGGIFNRTPSPDNQSPENNNNWIYPLLGSLIGLSLVLLVGYFLWKKGYLALPIKPKNDQ